MTHPPVLIAGSLRIIRLELFTLLMLASASPARRRLLEQAGIAHRVRVSGVDESTIHHPDPRELVQRLAEAKAQAVHAGLAPQRDHDITAVLGCDSVLAFEAEVFGKPADADEAIARWRRMAGGSAVLHSGHALLRGPVGSAAVVVQRDCVSTQIHFASLSEHQIRAYVASGEPLQCAGGSWWAVHRSSERLLLERDRSQPALVASPSAPGGRRLNLLLSLTGG